MNVIKYINPRTGERREVRIVQPSYAAMCQSYNFFRRGLLTMDTADRIMRRLGFVRAGKRWASAEARKALREFPA